MHQYEASRSPLYEQVCAFEDLLAAAYRARRGKRFRPDVVAFHHRLEAELLTLRDALRDRTYQPGPYWTFHIHDPKPRLISAAAYKDRIVHYLVDVRASVMSWIGHLRHGDTWGLLRQLLASAPFLRTRPMQPQGGAS